MHSPSQRTIEIFPAGETMLLESFEAPSSIGVYRRAVVRRRLRMKVRKWLCGSLAVAVVYLGITVGLMIDEALQSENMMLSIIAGISGGGIIAYATWLYGEIWRS